MSLSSRKLHVNKEKKKTSPETTAEKSKAVVSGNAVDPLSEARANPRSSRFLETLPVGEPPISNWEVPRHNAWGQPIGNDDFASRNQSLLGLFFVFFSRDVCV
jgi:hypothetical protein